MGVDTVKLRSPIIDEGLAQFLERQCILKQGIDLSDGEVLYEITSGDLRGSWDSRISFKVCREDYVTRNGRLELLPCDPFITVEASVHKFFFGQNIYGNPIGFGSLVGRFLEFLGEILAEGYGDEGQNLFASGDRWEVRRVDWAEMFRLTPEAQAEFFRGLKNVQFPRRAKKEAKYATAVHFPGKFTTLRIYGKGPEFKEHDFPRVRSSLTRYAINNAPEKTTSTGEVVRVAQRQQFEWVERKMKALQRLADHRLRAEVQINADKLHHDWKGRYPLVSEMTDEYMQGVFQAELFKLLREGKSAMQTVRTFDEVKARLNLLHKTRSANNLFAFWVQLATRGEAIVQTQYSKSQFYANRSKLVESGISWNGSDVMVIRQDTKLPRDFKPLLDDPRRCVGRVAANSIFNLCPVEQAQLRKAA